MNLNDLKDLILFAKKHKVHSVDVHGVKFELSAYSHAEEIEKTFQTTPAQKEELGSQKSLVDTEDELPQDEYEALLFHSSNS